MDWLIACPIKLKPNPVCKVRILRPVSQQKARLLAVAKVEKRNDVKKLPCSSFSSITESVKGNTANKASKAEGLASIFAKFIIMRPRYI